MPLIDSFAQPRQQPFASDVRRHIHCQPTLHDHWCCRNSAEELIVNSAFESLLQHMYERAYERLCHFCVQTVTTTQMKSNGHCSRDRWNGLSGDAHAVANLFYCQLRTAVAPILCSTQKPPQRNIVNTMYKMSRMECHPLAQCVILQPFRWLWAAVVQRSRQEETLPALERSRHVCHGLLWPLTADALQNIHVLSL